MSKFPSFTNILRPSFLGDIIASIPFLNYLEKYYPNSYKCAYIDKKCSQIIPFLINHPLIDKIQISDKSDEITEKDLKFFSQFDISFNPFPKLTKPDYFNYHHIIQELFCMMETMDYKKIDINRFNELSIEEKKPKLYQWFDIEKKDKTIAIWPFSGYTRDKNNIHMDLRSPTKEWWNKLIKMLPDYKILQLGHPNSELLNNNVIDCRKLGLFDAIKLSLGCNLTIGTDSGSQWIIGAYGHPQICVYTNYMENHFQNKDSFVPVNCNNNLISILGENKNINNINQELVLQSIKQLTN